MSKIRDRTEDFRDAVRRVAMNLGYNESKIASFMASFIMPKILEKSSFTKAALRTLESITTLEQFLLKHNKDYTDKHRTTKKERDSIEHEVTVSIKACKDQIDVLQNNINNEEVDSKRWLGVRNDSLNADYVAHKHGVVLIVSEKLHSVTCIFEHLKALVFQEAINRVAPRQKRRVSVKISVLQSSNSESSDHGESNHSEIIQSNGTDAEPIILQQQLIDDETRALQVELTRMLDAAQKTEKRMAEVSALNQVISSLVLQQKQQIELLFEQAVDATRNVELGNKELSQAIQRNSSSRTFLLLFFIVLTFSVLFLDWYN